MNPDIIRVSKTCDASYWEKILEFSYERRAKNDLYFDISIEHGIKWERCNWEWNVSQLLPAIGITAPGLYFAQVKLNCLN